MVVQELRKAIKGSKAQPSSHYIIDDNSDALMIEISSEISPKFHAKIF